MEHKKSAEKKWEKPQLIVLAKSKPEETVLAGCKYFVEQGTGADACATYNVCRSLINS